MPANAKKAPRTVANTAPDPYGIPDRPEDILDFLNRTAEPPQETDPLAFNQALAEKMRARDAACRKLLAIQSGKSHHAVARQMRMEALRILASQGDAQARNDLDQFADSLIESGEAESRELAEGGRLMLAADDFALNPEAHAEPLLRRLREYLDGEPTRERFETAIAIARTMSESGFVREAAKAHAMIATTAAESEDSDIEALAAATKNEAEFLQLKADYEELLLGSSDDSTSLAQRVKSLLEAPPISRSGFALASRIAEKLEERDEWTVVAELWDAIEQASPSAQDVELKAEMGDAVAMARRRQSLVGRKWIPTGLDLEDQPFDVDRTGGREKLLFFFQADSPFCQAEIQNLRGLRERFSEEELGILAISVGDPPEKLRKFVAESQMPCPCVRIELDAADSGTSDGSSGDSVVDQAGIVAVPYFILVDEDWKVIDRNPRSDRIRETLNSRSSAAATR